MHKEGICDHCGGEWTGSCCRVAKAHAEGIAAGLRMAAAEATARSHSHAGHLAMATTEVGHAHYSGCEMAESFLAAWCEAKAKEVER